MIDALGPKSMGEVLKVQADRTRAGLSPYSDADALLSAVLQAEAEADEEEVETEEPEEEEEAGEIYSSDSSASLATPFLAQIRVLKEIIQLTTAPPAPAPPPDAPTLAERASSEPAEVYFV